MNKKFLMLAVVIIIVGIPLAGMLKQQLGRSPEMMKFDSSYTTVSPAMPAQEGQRVMGGVMMDKAESGVAESNMMYSTSTIMPVPADGFVVNAERSIVKSASLALQVENPQESVNNVNQIVSDNQGLVTSSNVYDYDMKNMGVRADLTVRVPTDRLQATMDAIKSIATKVVSESTNAQDQTEQRVDLEAQLKNLRATEEQLLQIMSKAGTVEETLKVQQQLTTTRGQIERLDAQLQNLQGSVQMASLSISLSTQADALPVVDNDTTIWGEMKLAVRDAYRLYRDMFIGGLKLIIMGAPILVLGLVATVLYRKMQKNKQ